jgi:hypothetical protein
MYLFLILVVSLKFLNGHNKDLLLFCYYYYYYYPISHFSASAGKHSPILEYLINSNRLGGIICNLKSFLQLNMFQELQIFAFVCTYSGAG